MEKISNRFGLRDYLNTSDLRETNPQIAKYILDNIHSFQNESLNSISMKSYFSEPTLSRFFKNVCGISFNRFIENDSLSLVHMQSQMDQYYTKENKDILQSLNQSINFIDEKTISAVTDKLKKSNRVLFIGPFLFQAYSFPIETFLLLSGKGAYSPLNYISQIFAISEMENNDLIFIHNISIDWKIEHFFNDFQNALTRTKAKKVLLCFEDTESFLNDTAEKIILGKSSIPLGDLQLSTFYKMIMCNFLESSEKYKF